MSKKNNFWKNVSPDGLEAHKKFMKMAGAFAEYAAFCSAAGIREKMALSLNGFTLQTEPDQIEEGK